MTVYLLHFSRPHHHARHYLSITEDLTSRLEQHRKGRGAVITRHGIAFTLARTWQGDKAFERRLKNRKSSPRLCPICTKGVRE